jgi:chromate transporter
VVAILFSATVTLGGAGCKEGGRGAIKGLIISAIAFINIYLLHLDIIIIILIGGVIGGLFYFKERPDKGIMDQSINNKIPIKIDKKDILIILSIMAVFTFLFMTTDNGWPIFFTFFKIGAFAFGGGYAAIPLIQHVVVDGMQWIDLKSFRDGIALGQITPGPVFITATFIGYKVNGVAGALIATIGVFSPSLIGVIIIKGLHSKIKDYMTVRAVIKGFLFTFLGLIASITIRFGIQSIIDVRTILLSLISVAYLLVWKKRELWLILGVIAISLILF